MLRLVACTVLVVATQVAGSPVCAQGSVKVSEAQAFLGTWVFTMTNPAGAQETVTIVDDNGLLSARVQAGRFPALPVTGILKDGDMLVLTVTRFENGKPIRAVISLIPNGASMTMGQMLEFSETIKRGSGTRK